MEENLYWPRPGQDEKLRRQYLKETYKEAKEKRFDSEENETSYQLYEFDLIGHDKLKTEVAFDVFVDPKDISYCSWIIEHAENEDTKLYVAKKLDVTSNIKSFYETFTSKYRKSINDVIPRKGEFSWLVQENREYIEKMIENTDGEAKEIITKKLEEFENTVKSFNPADPADVE